MGSVGTLLFSSGFPVGRESNMVSPEGISGPDVQGWGDSLPIAGKVLTFCRHRITDGAREHPSHYLFFLRRPGPLSYACLNLVYPRPLGRDILTSSAID